MEERQKVKIAIVGQSYPKHGQKPMPGEHGRDRPLVKRNALHAPRLVRTGTPCEVEDRPPKRDRVEVEALCASGRGRRRGPAHGLCITLRVTARVRERGDVPHDARRAEFDMMNYFVYNVGIGNS